MAFLLQHHAEQADDLAVLDQLVADKGGLKAQAVGSVGNDRHHSGTFPLDGNCLCEVRNSALPKTCYGGRPRVAFFIPQLNAIRSGSIVELAVSAFI